MECKTCETNDALTDNLPLVTFDESRESEGYVYITRSGNLAIDNDYSRTQISINYCPMCGRCLKD